MPLPEDPDGVRLSIVLAQGERELRRKILAAMTWLRSRYTEAELERMIEQRRFDELLQDVEHVALLLASDVALVTTQAGNSEAIALGTHLGQRVALDTTNWRAVRILQQHRIELSTKLQEEARRSISQALAEGARRGLNPRQTARLLRSSLGQTAPATEAIATYRAALEAGRSTQDRQLRDRRFDPSARRASTIPLTEEHINRMVQRYEERWLAHRAETIALTESLRAVHEGAEEMWQQAYDSGQVDPNQVTSSWYTAGDERVRNTHAPMHGQTRRHQEPFVSGGGALLRYPGDPAAPARETVRCRCVVTRRISG